MKAIGRRLFGRMAAFAPVVGPEVAKKLAETVIASENPSVTGQALNYAITKREGLEGLFETHDRYSKHPAYQVFDKARDLFFEKEQVRNRENYEREQMLRMNNGIDADIAALRSVPYQMKLIMVRNRRIKEQQENKEWTDRIKKETGLDEAEKVWDTVRSAMNNMLRKNPSPTVATYDDARTTK